MKKIFSFLAVALLSMSAMAGTITIDGSSFSGGTNDGKGSDVKYTQGGVTVSTNAGYADGKELRVYQNGTITITSQEKMTKISFTVSSKSCEMPDVTPNSTTWSKEIPSGTGLKAARISQIVITIDGEVEGGDEKEEGEGEGDGEGEGEDLNYTISFKNAEVYNFFDYLTDDSENITIYLYGEEEDPYDMQIDLLVKAGTGIGKQLPEGTYKIDETFAVGSAVVGFEDEETEEALGTWFTDLENLFMIPAMGGTVVVGKNSINVNLTYEDEEGAINVKASYSGDLTIEEGELIGEEAVENVDAEVKVMKSIENGQLIIRRGENSYNVMGVAM